MPTQYKLIALDVDGTLMNKKQEISEENRHWIDRAREAGIEVTLSTGRHRNGIIQTFAKQLNIRVPMVTLNGGEVWTQDGGLLSRTALSHDDVTFLHGLAQEHRTGFWGSNVEGPFGQNEFPYHVTDSIWLKFGFNSNDPKIIETLWNRLREHGGFELTNSDPLNIEVNPKGVSKAEGLQVVCNVLNIEPHQVVTMGDSLNDIAMIQWAGLGIAMGNAQHEVKQVANWVTDTCENHGVARAIEKILHDGRQ